MIPENHVARRVGEAVQARISALKPGQKMQDLPQDLWHESFKRYVLMTPNRGGGPNLRLVRLDPDLPSLTVTGYIFNKFVHPTEDRFISVREAARLQGFPDSVSFHGTLTSTQLQVGNAVPPPLANAVLASVVAMLRRGGDLRISALSLFSGAGGFDLGARDIPGLEVALATDLWSDAVATMSGWVAGDFPVVQADVSEVDDPEEFWKKWSGLRESPRLIFGGPPCQSFSQAGKQRSMKDLRGMLVFDYLRFVDALRPDAFILENVSNLKGVDGGAVLRRLEGDARSLGYSVSWRILKAVDYGVPQRRRRFFLVGLRDHAVEESVWPVPSHGPNDIAGELKPYATVGEAFDGLPSLVSEV